MPTSFLYIIAVLIGGVSWFPMLFQLGVVPVEQSIAYRFLLSGALMLFFCLATQRRLTFTLRDHATFAVQGLVLFTACFLLFFYALSYLASGLLAVCYSTILVMNIANGMIFFRHRSDRAVGIGAAFGLVGIALVFWPEIARFEAGNGALIGLALALAATYAASLGNMVSVYHKMANLPVIPTTAWAMTYGGLFTFLIALVVAPDFTFDPRLPLCRIAAVPGAGRVGRRVHRLSRAAAADRGRPHRLCDRPRPGDRAGAIDALRGLSLGLAGGRRRAAGNRRQCDRAQGTETFARDAARTVAHGAARTVD
ncbi:MAG: DMT family transporter [Dongiaceae bacterium]